jgi:hypothetical protein
MPPRRSLPPDAELAVKGHVEPVLINGGQTVKSLSAAFLADLEQHWRCMGAKLSMLWPRNILRRISAAWWRSQRLFAGKLAKLMNSIGH